MNNAIELCERWIVSHARPRKTKNSSAFAYQLKHEVERANPGAYVSEEDIIRAAAKYGYPPKDKDGYRMKLRWRNADHIDRDGKGFFAPCETTGGSP